MTKEEIIERLRDLQTPQRTDPYWENDPGFMDRMIESLIQDIEDNRKKRGTQVSCKTADVEKAARLGHGYSAT